VSPPGWPAGLQLRLAILADLHACDPWMPLARVERIVARTNALAPDATLLLGDYIVGTRLGRLGSPVPYEDWTRALAGLAAPLGVHAVLGNHDWWDDAQAQRTLRGPCRAHLALEKAGIPVYENDAMRLSKDGQPLWIAGLGDQWAFWPKHRGKGMRPSQVREPMGVDDLAGTLAKVTDNAPVILMAHEPDIFPAVPARVSLTISGHTHGGQVRILGFSPIIPSRYGRRFDYGHIVERDGQGEGARDKHLIVSAGLGVSGLPVRFGMPPEIVVVEIGSEGGQRVTGSGNPGI
jgi:hypothetical protein